MGRASSAASENVHLNVVFWIKPMFKVKTTKETKTSPCCYTKGDVAREVLLLS